MTNHGHLLGGEPDIVSLFSGYGGLDIAVQQVLGGQVAVHVDNDPGATAILAHHWPHVPNLGDITAVDWHGLDVRLAPIRILTGGFPCQDVSAAGRRAGLTPDSRSGLWTHMARAIAVLQPQLVVIENVRGLLSATAHRDVEPGPAGLGDGGAEPVLRALGAVLGDLAQLGYDAVWHGLRAADVGAPHGRFRVFIAAVPNADSAARVEWRQPAPGQAESWGSRADARGRSGVAAADGQRQVPIGSESAVEQDWVEYEPAIRRWEHVLGRPAPEPTMPAARSVNPVLSPRFVEWLMGLPTGHVTDVPGLSCDEQFIALGNGVVPQQAAAALRHCLQVLSSFSTNHTKEITHV